MRNYEIELRNRVAFIQNLLKKSHCNGIVFGNSGGKDCALVGILCKKACDNVLGVRMPCQSKRNFESDFEDAGKAAEQFNIETKTVDLSEVKSAIFSEISKVEEISPTASSNINPRLRMATLYAIAQSRNALVAGTGNRSEIYMGYFTKWGDGAFDFNPIADLTVTEVYEFLEYLNAPRSIIEKAPSAGLFEGQTDEQEMGVTYREIDEFILTGKTNEQAEQKIKSAHAKTEHKRAERVVYKG